MKNFKRNDLIKSNNEYLRFIARCSICETKVKGTPEQFTLSDVINKKSGKIECAAFNCPRCHNIAKVRIDQITVVEEVVTI